MTSKEEAAACEDGEGVSLVESGVSVEGVSLEGVSVEGVSF